MADPAGIHDVLNYIQHYFYLSLENTGNTERNRICFHKDAACNQKSFYDNFTKSWLAWSIIRGVSNTCLVRIFTFWSGKFH